MRNKRFIKILKVSSINFNLKSDLEKKAILNSYKIFLKSCNFNVQILVQSSIKNLEGNKSNIQKHIEKSENTRLKDLGTSYIEYLDQLNKLQKSSAKNFFIIISKTYESKEIKYEEEIVFKDLKDKFFKIKESLLRCGNSVLEVDTKEESLEIINSFINIRRKEDLY